MCIRDHKMVHATTMRMKKDDMANRETKSAERSPTMSVDEAAGELGIGRNQAYAAAKAGQIPAIRIGKRLLVLRFPLERMLRGEGKAA
jgi:excisionase family DNA binding protein